MLFEVIHTIVQPMDIRSAKSLIATQNPVANPIPISSQLTEENVTIFQE